MKLSLKRKKSSQPGRQPVPAGRARVFSYYANSPPETTGAGTARHQPPKRSFNWRRLPSLLALITVVISLLYGLSLDTNPRINVLSGQDQAPLLQNTSVYRAAAQDILKSSLANRSKLTINTEAIADELRDRYPELAAVSVTVPLASHRLVFELEPVEPRLVLANRGGAYVVDERGFAVVATKDVPSLTETELIHVIDETGLEIKAGASVLPDEHTAFIIGLSRQLKAQNIAIEQLTLPPVPNELRLRLKGERYYVKFDMQGDVRLQAGTFIAVRKHLKDSGKTPAEYIDVRVEERAFYK